jgi:hypothetical protein
MNRNRRTWIIGISFWALLILSVGFSGRYPWLDALWFIGIVFFILVTSFVPRFAQWALWDDEQFKIWGVKPRHHQSDRA